MWYLISIITIAQFIDNDHSAHRSDVSVDLLFDNGISAVSNSLSGQIPNPQSPRPRDKIMERKNDLLHCDGFILTGRKLFTRTTNPQSAKMDSATPTPWRPTIRPIAVCRRLTFGASREPSNEIWSESKCTRCPENGSSYLYRLLLIVILYTFFSVTKVTFLVTVN